VTRTVDVVIVGGGAIGLAAALMLARDGREVVVIERERPGAGASYGNAGQVRVSECMPLASRAALREAVRTAWSPRAPVRVAVPATRGTARWGRRFVRAARSPITERAAALAALGRLSRTLLDELVLARPDARVGWRSGALDVYETHGGLNAAAHDADLAHRHGFSCDVLDAGAARRLEPLLGESIAGALHFPGDGSLEPAALVAALEQLGRTAGVEILAGRAADSLVVRDGDVHAVVGDGAAVRCRHVILAGGTQALDMLQQRWPVVPGRGFTLDLATAAPLARPLVLAERHAAATPLDGRVRLAGGMVIGARRAQTAPRAGLALARGIADVLPALAGARVTQRWTGMRPMTPDGLPLIGPTAPGGTVLVAAGHGMLGMTYALGTGSLIADLVAGRAPAIDVTPFSPMRFDSTRRRTS
jgi:D-amino-acid dehydrogenase